MIKSRYLKVIIGFLCVFTYVSCTSGPPRIIETFSGTELSFNPIQTAPERAPFLVVIADDPDGTKDIESIVVEIDNGERYWEWQRDDLQSVEKNHQASYFLRRPSSGAGTGQAFFGPATVVIRDRAGSEDRRTITISPMAATDNLVIPKAEKNSETLTITGEGLIRLNVLSFDGAYLLSKDTEAGTFTWSELGLSAQNNDLVNVYLQQFKVSGSISISSGPW